MQQSNFSQTLGIGNIGIRSFTVWKQKKSCIRAYPHRAKAKGNNIIKYPTYNIDFITFGPIGAKAKETSFGRTTLICIGIPIPCESEIEISFAFCFCFLFSSLSYQGMCYLGYYLIVFCSCITSILDLDHLVKTNGV